MGLDPGTRLGPYGIVGALGAGGMGEVYRARDTRLDRTVAVKVLPRELAADPDRRARFEREARAVAALDHPHICGIHDVGEADGTHFLVMPLLEGQTLAARLEKGPLPLDQALTIATQIADALDKAHRQGIVHRDLKPANIMLTKTGAKLLDFGLAKLRGPTGPVSLSGMTRLAPASPGTAQGTILGTLHYMAPEQVEGTEADARSDIWALGAVLYEMVTGGRPFAGETPASVIGAILKDTPPALSSRQPLAPRALDHLVARCLAKDPDNRWQSSGDVGGVLESIAPIDSADTDRRARPAGTWRERAAWIAATAALLAALAFSTLWRAPTAPATDVIRVSITAPEGTVFTAHASATVPTPQFAMSPDGRAVAFVAAAPGRRPALWVRSLQEVDARLFQGTDEAQEPIFWSPDNRWVGFADALGNLKRVELAGGTVQTITTGVADARGASWGRDDTIVFGIGYGGVYRVAASGGKPEPVTKLDASRQEGSHRWPRLLPDGRHFFFTVRSGLADQRGVWLAALGEDARHRLLVADVDAHYVDPGYILFLDGDTLLAQPWDNGRLEPSGQPVPVAARVGQSSRGNGAYSPSVAGTLAYAAAMRRPGRLSWFDRNGKPLGSVGLDGEHDYSDFRLSPDETRLAASLVDPKLSLPDIWSTDLVRGGNSRWTFGPSINAAAVWSPNGDRIAFRTNRKGLTEIYQKRPLAGDSDEPLLLEDVARASGVGSSNLTPTDWSADGRYLAFTSNTGNELSDIFLLPLADPTKPARFVRSQGDRMHANFSPDGRFLAYTSNESGRFEVYVETAPVSEDKWPVSTNGGYEPRWRADGKELYYLSEDRVLMAVPVSSGTNPFGVPRPLFQTQVHPGISMLRTHYVPSRDGTRFLIHTRSGDAPPATITVVLNWTALLTR